VSESGATTAEYAVGTLGAVSLASILIALGIDPWFARLLWDLVRDALDPTLLLDHLTR
jgi:hypothetical protein